MVHHLDQVSVEISSPIWQLVLLAAVPTDRRRAKVRPSVTTEMGAADSAIGRLCRGAIAAEVAWLNILPWNHMTLTLSSFDN